MSILVTGGTGFVGLNVIEALINRGEHVVVMDRRPISSAFLRAIGSKQSLVCLESGDVCDQTVVDAVFADHQITHVFLGAAITAGPNRELADPDSVIEVNLLGNLNILRASSRTGVKRVMFPSSLTVYGSSLFDRFVCHEAGTPPIPEGLYGITKYAGERMVLRMADLMKLEAVTGRIGAVFGPWETSTGVRDLVSPLAQIARACVKGFPVVLPSAYPRREMIYSRDLAEAIVLLMFAPKLSHDTYNLSCNSKWEKTPELWCEAIAKRFPSFSWSHQQEDRAATIDYYDMRDRASLDATRIKKDLGFNASHRLPDVMDDYAQWLQANADYFSE
jgi:nucleoside-diphosphate-sugar epimerase